MRSCSITLSSVTSSKKYYHQNKEFKIIADVWLCGSAEKDEEGVKFPGAYPAGFMKRLKSAFKDFYPKDRLDILHVCSGRISPNEGLRLDIDTQYEPDFVNDAENMVEIEDEEFLWVQSDTPYNKEASSKYYGKPMVNRSSVIKEMTRVCKVGGFVAMLDQISPNNVPRCLKRIALIGVTSIPNQDMRIFTVFHKEKKYEPTASKKEKQKE